MTGRTTTKTILTFLGLITAVILVSFALLLVALVTGSKVWAWASPVEAVIGLAAATFWLVSRVRQSGRAR